MHLLAPGAAARPLSPPGEGRHCATKDTQRRQSYWPRRWEEDTAAGSHPALPAGIAGSVQAFQSRSVWGAMAKATAYDAYEFDYFTRSAPRS